MRNPDPDSPKGTHPLASAGKRIIDRSEHFSFLDAEFLKGFSRYHAKRKKNPSLGISAVDSSLNLYVHAFHATDMIRWRRYINWNSNLARMW